MKQEISLKEILEDSLKDFNNNGFYGINSLVGYQSDLIKEAMKKACNQCLDLAAENATTKKIEIPYTGVRAGGFYTVDKVDKDSILNIKNWIV